MKLSPIEAIINFSQSNPAKTQLPTFYDNPKYVNGSYPIPKKPRLVNLEQFYFDIATMAKVKINEPINIDLEVYINQILGYLNEQELKDLRMRSNFIEQKQYLLYLINKIIIEQLSLSRSKSDKTEIDNLHNLKLNFIKQPKSIT